MRIDQDARDGGEMDELGDETHLADSPAGEANLPPVGTHAEADVPEDSEHIDLGEHVHADDD